MWLLVTAAVTCGVVSDGPTDDLPRRSQVTRPEAAAAASMLPRWVEGSWWGWRVENDKIEGYVYALALQDDT